MKLKKAVSAALLLVLAGCRAAETEVPAATPSVQPSEQPSAEPEPASIADGVFEAGDLLVNIRGVWFADVFDRITAPENCRFLVADVCAADLSSSPVMVYDTDFQVSWGEGDGLWTMPLTASKSGISAEGMFPERYELAPGEEKQGYLLFAVPEDVSEFVISMKDGDEVYCLTVQGE